MTTSYIISQILAFLSFWLWLFAYYRNKKEKIMYTVITANFLNLLHYLVLWALSWSITKVLAVLRDSLIVYKEKKHFNLNIVLGAFVILYISFAIYTYQWFISIFPLLAALIYTISIWNWNAWVVKKAAFSCYFFRLIYDIYVWSIVAVWSDIISIISSFIAVVLHYKNGNSKKKVKKNKK